MENKISLLDIALGVERRGVAFYDTVARSTDNPDTAHAFKHLADMERDHVQLFEKMLTEPFELPEYSDYLKNLVENSVFSSDKISSQFALDADTPEKAIELGVIAEKDSILLYYELRDVLPAASHWQIERIIGEEKRHLNELADLKKKIEGERQEDG